jgi:cytochrome b6
MAGEEHVTPTPAAGDAKGNGDNGGAPPTLLDKTREGVELLKRDPRENQLWTSVFRHKLDDSPRNRSLAVLSNVFLHLHPAKLNRDAVRYAFTWGMGGISFYLFVVLTLTGVFLMFYYHPTKGQAFRDILYLKHDVPFGNLLRNMHRWTAHGMIITVWLHMLRVFLTGSYKPPREFNWGVGVLLLVLTMLLSFTGYLLPDDQLGFWAVTVGTNMARATPLLGHEGPFGAQLGMTAFNDIRFALLGGSIVDSNALLRAYIWHCIGLPVVISVFMIVHFWRIRKDGSISGPAPVKLASEFPEWAQGPKPRTA